MRLSEDLRKWRADRPDEWTMDRFIQEAARLEAVVEKFTSTNSAMDAIRKAYIEGYSMGHHHTVESCYWPEQAADDWLSEQHQ